MTAPPPTREEVLEGLRAMADPNAKLGFVARRGVALRAIAYLESLSSEPPDRGDAPGGDEIMEALASLPDDEP